MNNNDVDEKFNNIIKFLTKIICNNCNVVITLYFLEHHFEIQYGSALSDIIIINGVLLGCILFPILYNIMHLTNQSFLIHQ